MGFSREAFHAGQMPKISPTAVASSKAISTREGRTRLGKGATFEIRFELPTPRATPMKPPKVARMAASRIPTGHEVVVYCT